MKKLRELTRGFKMESSTISYTLEPHQAYGGLRLCYSKLFPLFSDIAQQTDLINVDQMRVTLVCNVRLPRLVKSEYSWRPDRIEQVDMNFLHIGSDPQVVLQEAEDKLVAIFSEHTPETLYVGLNGDYV